MKRRAQTVTSIEYDVALARPLSCSTAAFAAHELVKHLLFMRGQAPALIDELAAEVDAQADAGSAATPEAAGHSRRPARDRKLLRFISRVEGITAALTPAALQRSSCVLILLGPSPLRPMEAYSLNWPAARISAGDAEGALDAEQAEQAARDASRRVLRSLIGHTASEQEGQASAGPTKLFIMLQAPELQEAPPGFLPKRAFQPRQRKGLQVQMRLRNPQDCGGSEAGTCCAPQEAQQQPESSPRGDPDSDAEGAVAREAEVHMHEGLMWYQCITHVKGICASSQSASIDDFL